MKRAVRMKAAFVVLAVLLTMTFFVSCGPKPFLTTVTETKIAAEDALYYARAYYNQGRLSESQFNTVRDAYDALYVVQNKAIDARIAYLKLPGDPTTTQKYKFAQEQVIQAALAFTQIAIQLGVIEEGQSIEPIPIRK